MEQELFICDCGNVEHQIVFSWFKNNKVDGLLDGVFATVHLRKKPFLRRLIYGLKYIFGHQCKYGAFDEFIFNPDDAYKLKNIYDFLNGTPQLYNVEPVNTQENG